MTRSETRPLRDSWASCCVYAGAVFGALASVEVLCVVLGAVTFNTIYSETLDIATGFVFLVMAAFYAVACILLLSVYKQMYWSGYDKPSLPARCCHLANDLTNFTGDRRTDRQTNRRRAPSRKAAAVASVGLIIIHFHFFCFLIESPRAVPYENFRGSAGSIFVRMAIRCERQQPFTIKSKVWGPAREPARTPKEFRYVGLVSTSWRWS